MKLRLPLFAQILAWFFLNLAVLAGVAWLLVRSNFSLGLDSALLAHGDARVQALTDLVMSELRERPRTEWDAVLRRFSTAYRLDLQVSGNREGERVAGPDQLLPAVVHARLILPERLGETENPPHRERPPGFGAPQLPPPDPADFGRDPYGMEPPPSRGARSSTPKYLVRAEARPHYWLISRAMLRPTNGPRQPVSLIAAADSIGFNGLLMDFTPWLLAIGVAALVSALFWIPFVRGLTRTIGEMKTTSQQIAEGHFNATVPERRRDELGDLGHAINRMAEQLGSLVGGQKRFLGDVAHELCAPIARIQMALGILEQRADERQKAYVEDLREEVQHMSQIVNELLSFSKAALKPQEIKLTSVPLAPLVRRVIAREAGDSAQVTVEIPENLTAQAEPELLARALGNVVRNALRYAGKAGPISVRAHSEGATVVLAVRDQGAGVPAVELEKIFAPFYRPDLSRTAATGGAGLGLAIVKTCIEACQGTVSARNRKSRGLRVEFRLRA